VSVHVVFDTFHDWFDSLCLLNKSHGHSSWIGFNLLSLHRLQVHNVFSAFNPSLVIKEQWAAVSRPGSNWGFSALLMDTSTGN